VILATVLGGVSFCWWLTFYFGKVAEHRFCLDNDKLIVDTGDCTRTFPAPARKVWRGSSRYRTWLAVSDTFGRWPDKYCLDPCWIEMDDEPINRSE